MSEKITFPLPHKPGFVKTPYGKDLSLNLHYISSSVISDIKFVLIHYGKILRRFKIRPHPKWPLLDIVIRYLMYLLTFSYRKL